MKFRAKIWMLPVCAAAVFFVGLATSYAVGSRTSSALSQLRSVDYPYQEAVANIDRGIEKFRVKLQAAASEGDEAALDDVVAIAKTTKASIGEIARLDGKKERSEAFDAIFETYQASAIGATRAMIGKSEAGDHMAKMQSSMVELDKLVDQEKQGAAAAVASAQDRAAKGVDANLWVGLATGLIVLFVLGAASRLIVRSVWRDLGDEPELLRERVQRIAAGDLSRHGDDSGDDSSLRAAVDQMTEQLRSTVGLIRLSTDSISTASTEIAVGNQDLSRRTEQTAANLQKTAASMEQLTGTVHQSAVSARQANELSTSAAGAAERGGQIVSQVVVSMEGINAASQRITEIIGTIDGIAFQTNILALNAAVEAARAGEQGRGFAVVAGEVRSLAQRSAEAAKEIKSLIHASSEKVESGARLVRDAGEAMQDIVTGVERVNAIITEMGAATAEQSQDIGSVNGAVGELDQMTQQNSALVEESAAAAESLRQQAKRLAESVAVFRLDTDGPGRVVTPTVAGEVSVPYSTVRTPVPRVTTRPERPAPAAASSSHAEGDWDTF